MTGSPSSPARENTPNWGMETDLEADRATLMQSATAPASAPLCSSLAESVELIDLERSFSLRSDIA